MITLRVVGIIYLLSASWCVLAAADTLRFLGFGELSGIGLIEFYSVYGGLQLGIALALLISSFRSAYIESALFFAFILSIVLFLARALALLVIDDGAMLIPLAILELLIAVALWLSWLRMRSSASQ